MKTATRIEDDAANNAWLVADSETELARVILPHSVTSPSGALEMFNSMASELAPDYTPPPTSADVNVERDRRIVAGKTINGVAVTGRDEDARNLTNLALAAQLRIGQADTTTLTTFRDGNNVDHDLTPPEVLALWQQSASYVSALYAASWVIKAMDPIPDDYADDARWATD